MFLHSPWGGVACCPLILTLTSSWHLNLIIAPPRGVPGPQAMPRTPTAFSTSFHHLSPFLVIISEEFSDLGQQSIKAMFAYMRHTHSTLLI